jgi:hypothetical protein
MSEFTAAFNDAMVASVSLHDQLTELKRERRMRERAYPRFIEKKTLTTDQAMQAMLRLDAAIATIRKQIEQREPGLGL